MNQPELGRKILSLRKAKGLTQEELVSKCKLNVRTLQRIESGEVMPRNYTVRAIFTALDYFEAEEEFIQNEEEEENISNAPIENRLDQLPGNSFDVFNLKTNTVKKLLILLVVILCLVCAGTGMLYRQKDELKNQLVGTWVLCNSHGVMMSVKINANEFKVITPETFTVLILNRKNKTVMAELMGTYSLNKNKYSETITNAFLGMTDYPGTVNDFEIRFKNDLLIIEGQNNSYNQTWKRVKPEDLKATVSSPQ